MEKADTLKVHESREMPPTEEASAKRRESSRWPHGRHFRHHQNNGGVHALAFMAKTAQDLAGRSLARHRLVDGGGR